MTHETILFILAILLGIIAIVGFFSSHKKKNQLFFASSILFMLVLSFLVWLAE